MIVAPVRSGEAGFSILLLKLQENTLSDKSGNWNNYLIWTPWQTEIWSKLYIYEHIVVKWQMKINFLLTLNGDEECEDEERGEDEGGEGFVRESHLVNSFDSWCGKYKTMFYIYI